MILLLVALSGCAGEGKGDGCGGAGPCALPDGQYFAVEPAGWDGQSPLPTLVFAHAYKGSPGQYYNDEDVVAAFAAAGALLVLPQSEGVAWNLSSFGGPGRDDLLFFDEVLEDVGARWPVDEDRLYAGGFSLGGSMAYELACERGDLYAAVQPISGAFWEPLPEDCPSGDVPVRHVHGTADTTWPVEGQEFGDGFGQGSAADTVAFWREHDGCGPADDPPDDTVVEGPETCSVWSACDPGVEVRLCLHDEGHHRVDGWAERMLDWVLRFRLSDRESGADARQPAGAR